MDRFREDRELFDLVLALDGLTNVDKGLGLACGLTKVDKELGLDEELGLLLATVDKELGLLLLLTNLDKELGLDRLKLDPDLGLKEVADRLLMN